MTKIYLIRHAQAEGNAYRMMQGQWDGGVTRQGLRQIELLSERFREFPVDAVYASDLYRARKTAEAITLSHDLPLHTDPALREIDLGPWECRFFPNLCREQPRETEAFLHDPAHFYLPGAETYAQVGERMLAAMERIARRHSGQTVAVVSHGAAIRCFLSLAGGLSLDDTGELPIQRNTAVSTLLWEGKRFQILAMNDWSHLAPLKEREWGQTPGLRDEILDPAQDRSFYTACYRDAWLASHGDLTGYFADPYFEAAKRHHRADPGAVLRILDGDEPIGLVDMDTRRGAAEGYGWLSLIYLKPEYRNRGCGAQLLARALLRYRDLGRSALRLHVAEDNALALSFYRREGFRILSRSEGVAGGLLLLEKSLGGPEE